MERQINLNQQRGKRKFNYLSHYRKKSFVNNIRCFNKLRIFKFSKRKLNYYVLELKTSLNNFFINFFEYNHKNKRVTQVYYISAGIVFNNSAKTDKFVSNKLVDIISGFIFYFKFRKIIVRVLSRDYRIKQFLKGFKTFKKFKYGFFFLFYVQYLKFVFNGVKLTRKKR